ncbi:MAG TPA: prolyl oligopeptidase family serine peptidase [Candidatus Acidoferrum sp.]|nr:prolyl oligopeptidase family serine peptidase [Candidatus Acidoferrum sp.]
MRWKTRGLILSVIGAVVCLAVCGSAFAQAGITTSVGTLPDGATYLMEVPANWNGVLFLYSHGYVVPGSKNPAQDVGDPATRFFMLASGFALAGSSYKGTGWAVQEALPDQIAVLDVFEKAFGKPARTIAWGHSLGGMITAGLIQRYPERFDAALPMCGVLSGGVATWNTALDAAFAFKNLVAPGSGLQLVNITNPVVNLQIAEAANLAAQATPQGRARAALVAALGDTPGWFTPLSPEPAATDLAAQEANQFLWAEQVDFPFAFALRAELEARAGGNPSWNTGVDYQRQFERSANREEVRALYQAAGLDLEADLKFLNESPRIEANPPSTAYLIRNIIYNGEIHVPVLTLHTTGDGLVVVENESAYKDVVEDEANGRFLRRTFVSRAGHCAFTPAETIAAVQTLLERLETGRWPDVSAVNLNTAAAGLGPAFNIFANAQGMIIPTAPAFLDFKPARYLRPFDAETEECKFGLLCRDEFSRFDDRH